jgi:hypothetical protein
MTNEQIDRLLDGDPSFGVVPLIAAKAMQMAGKKEPAPVAPIIVVAPPPPPPPPPPSAGLLPVLAVSLLGLGAGAGIGYMFSRRS